MSGINLSNMEHNFQLLLKRMRFLYAEKQKLEQKVLEGQEDIAGQQARITELEEKIKMLKMSVHSGDGTPADNTFKKEMRSTLNAYIQEIDNCIAILNK